MKVINFMKITTHPSHEVTFNSAFTKHGLLEPIVFHQIYLQSNPLMYLFVYSFFRLSVWRYPTFVFLVRAVLGTSCFPSAILTPVSMEN